jgi:hypothetical protein
MRAKSFLIAGSAALLILSLQPVGAQDAPAGGRARPAPTPPHKRASDPVWRLAPADQQYASIDGNHLLTFVDELTAMSRRYRDNGHPQFWGRIIGTEADTENAEWMLAKFRQFGLTDVHEQYFDLPPQWMPQSWSVAASSNGKNLALGTAQPTYLAVATPSGGLDLEAVYAGLGSEADINLSRNVKGKAVFFYSTDTASRHVGISDNAIKRLADRGAAAIFIIPGLPGNIRTQFYPVNSPVPTFTLGQQDGLAMRDMIAAAAGEPVHVKLSLNVSRVPNLRSGTVWGTLPGVTDENVIVVAHRDGWFEGANDDAAGVATMVGMAEFFSRVPKEQRRRTIIFMGTTGHHNNSAESGTWLGAHPEVFAKTALLFNAEHTGLADTGHNSIRPNDQPASYNWYAGRTQKLADIVVNAMNTFGVPSGPQSSGSPPGEIGRFYQYAPSIEIINGGYVWHSDHEVSETISPIGLAAVTRTYAKVINDTANMPIAELRRAESK